MQPSLTLREEELARSLKQQGKSTQEIMGALAQARTAQVTPPREAITPQKPLAQRVVQDIPSDFMEMGQGVRRSVQDSSQRLGATWRNPNANFIQKLSATGPQLGKSVLDVGGEALVGYGKMLTTDELEKAVVQKIGETGQAAMGTKAAKNLSSWYARQDEDTKFLLSQIVTPSAEVMFEGTTLGAGAAATQPIKRGLAEAGEAIGREVADVAGDVASIGRQTDAPIQAPLPPEVKETIVRGFDVAIKPNLASKQTPVQRAQYDAQVAQAVETISNNVGNLRLIDDATGETISKLPENLKEFVDAIEQTKQAVFKQYDDLAAQAGESGARVDTIRVANELDDIINSRSLKLSNPEAIRYAQEVRGRLLDTRLLSTLDAQDVIRNYNNSLDAFYRNPTPEGLTRNAVDALVANQLRKALDDEIDALTGANYQGLKREYGALKAVERDIMRAYNRDARRNQKGLIDFTDVLTGGQVVSGILSMNPAMIGQGIAGKAIAGAIKMVNDPNRKVKQIFQEAGRYRRPDAGPTGPTRRQLPPARPDTPRSEVGSGAPVAVGGQTVRGRVEPGITERAREGAVRRSDSEARMTETEKRLKEDKEAVNQAVAEMEAEMTGETRISIGDNLVQSADGGYYRFNELPSWIPKGLRDSALMSRVMENILSGKKAREGTKAAELQEVVQKHINDRVEGIKKGKGDVGVFSTDTAFAVALMAGGTYFYMTQDGEMLPVVAVGAMMANPKARKAAVASAKNANKKGAKLPTSYKRKIAEALEDYDAGFMDVRRDGARVSIAPDATDQRIAELQKKNFAGVFTDKDAFEAEELMARKGIFLEPGGKAKGATPSTTLYHGSSQKITGDIRPSEAGILGKGFYLTQDPKVAEMFGKTRNVPEEDVIEGLQKITDSSIVPEVYSIDVSKLRLKELTDADGLQKALGKRKIEELQKELAQQGFDGISLTRRGEHVVFPGSIKKVQLTDTTPPTTLDPKNFKTAEEYVKAQGTPLFHGTAKGNTFSELKTNSGMFGNMNNEFHQGNVIYLTDSGKAADYFSKSATRNAKLRDRSLSLEEATGGAEQSGEIIDVFLKQDAKVKTLDYRPNKTEVDKLKEQGFDAVTFPEEAFNAKDLARTDVSGLNSKTTAILNEKAIKTRSQLKDEWKKANQ